MATLVFASNIFLLVYFLSGTASSQDILPGSLLFPTSQPTSWPSPSGRFAFGFYKQGDGFKVGIWLYNENDKTIVWTANRDDPPVNSNATIVLTTNDGLILQTGPGKKKVIADLDSASLSHASMLDSGNLVLKDENLNILWQSFDHPTDTMLDGQIFPGGTVLVSSSSYSDQSSGRFQLSMQGDGNLVLYPRQSYGDSIDAYWASTIYDGTSFKYYLFLNSTYPNLLCVVNANDSKILWCPDHINSHKGNNSIYRATIDFDGVLRLYAHFVDTNGKHQVLKLWSPKWLDNLCNVKTFCGFNSYCTVIDKQPCCNCLPGTDFIDPRDQKLGCKRNFSEADCKDGKDDATFYNIASMANMSLGDLDRPYAEEKIQKDECPDSCLQDCYCGAASYNDGLCKKKKLPIRYVKRENNLTSYTIYLKVGHQSLKSDSDNQSPTIKTNTKKAIKEVVLIVFGFAILVCSAVAIASLFIYKIGVLSYKRLLEVEDFGLSEGITLRLFSYNELKKATNGFKQEVGKGSFGSVYRGTLHKGRKVIAVKRLHRLIEGEREFQAEMKAIGKTHHKNLVRLLGYCAEGSKRLLVYEYMSNGSLDKLIFGDHTLRPDWDQRRRIALDIARGLLYLHEQCRAPIIHCDIKPQNILMDEFWTAKVSDFGLAKLLMPDQTRTFTQVRGTRGYLAPEWNKNTPISVKADVYSYGVMLLEIVFCRKNWVFNTSNPEEIVLSNWVYKCFVRRELHKLVIGEDVDNTLLENMVKVGLWCIQDEPFLRPSMKSVVLMLDGVVTDVAIPPCPSLDST